MKTEYFNIYPDTTLRFYVDSDNNLKINMPDEFRELYEVKINSNGNLVLTQKFRS